MRASKRDISNTTGSRPEESRESRREFSTFSFSILDSKPRLEDRCQDYSPTFRPFYRPPPQGGPPFDLEKLSSNVSPGGAVEKMLSLPIRYSRMRTTNQSLDSGRGRYGGKANFSRPIATALHLTRRARSPARFEIDSLVNTTIPISNGVARAKYFRRLMSSSS